MNRKFWHTFILLSILILNSCLGISTDIQMRKDGSGKITLEYRFSRMAEAIGRLDGNERWNIIPVGRADWERTITRIPDIKLVSFSSSEKAQDIVNKATLEFKNTDALLKFLDPTGKRAFLSRENGINKLHLTLNEGASSQLNHDLLELARQVSDGYSFSISVSAGNPAISFTDGEGREITPPPAAKISSSGKKASVSIGTWEILSGTAGLGLDIVWK